jgi:hypothetical protein
MREIEKRALFLFLKEIQGLPRKNALLGNPY